MSPVGILERLCRLFQHQARSGFTLVELLVVMSLLAVIALTAYGGLASGVRVWKTISASIEEVDLMLGWKKFRKDLINHLPFRGIGFHGTPREVSFPGLVAVKGAEGFIHQEVGRIRYRFDETNRCLCREEITYPDLIRGAEPDCRPVISSLKNVTMKYHGKEGGLESWSSTWEGEEVPVAVRLEMILEGTAKQNEIAKNYTETIP